MRAIWKGSITFSLVTIPISLYPATRREEMKFHMLRASDRSPINYKRIAATDEKEVPWDQIVKGYEYEKGKFVVLDEKDFETVNVPSTQAIEIISFVKLEEIDPIYFDKPYFLEPQKAGSKPYALFREALKRAKKVGIAKVVIRTRQHLAAVKPQGDALILELMHFSEELVKPTSLDIPGEASVGKKELDMACELIDRMTESWNPEHFKDDYRQALLELIQRKIESGGKAPARGITPKKPTKVVDLVSVLQRSLRQVEESSKPRSKRLRRAA